ncbi:amino acid permease [Salmonella enterica subsp. enterica serovar Poona]|nr:amino acid permease [Salmonella enterica subsp. enterica serovar Poona]
MHELRPKLITSPHHALILGISWAAIGIAILCYRKAHNQNIAIDLEGKKLLD